VAPARARFGKALERKIVLVPGNVFSVAGTADGFIRLNVSQMAPAVYEDLAGALETSA